MAVAALPTVAMAGQEPTEPVEEGEMVLGATLEEEAPGQAGRPPEHLA